MRKNIYYSGEAEAALDRLISFGTKDIKMTRSISLKRTDSGTKATSEKMVLGKSLSFKLWEHLEEAEPSKGNDATTELNLAERLPHIFSSPRPLSELDAAAVQVQKFYKSYRTRRNLADCAVVVEELWWKALDFASLKRSSVSFFNVEKPETAISRWARARTRAAKGLSKDEKAQKLALRHWLEAVLRIQYFMRLVILHSPPVRHLLAHPVNTKSPPSKAHMRKHASQSATVKQLRWVLINVIPQHPHQTDDQTGDLRGYGADRRRRGQYRNLPPAIPPGAAHLTKVMCDRGIITVL